MACPSRLSIVAAVGFVSLTVLSGTAYAYIDPGTGSYLFQLVTAGLFGAIVAVGVLWDGVKGFCRKCLPRRGRVWKDEGGGS